MFSRSLGKLAVVFCVSLLTACGGDSPSSPIGGGDTGGVDGGSGGGGDGSTTVVKIGSGTGASFVENTLAASNTSLQAGASTNIVVNLVDANNTAISDELEVSFSSDCVANALANFSENSVTTSAGRASITYTAQGCSGTDTVVARTVVNGTTLQASIDLSIAPDQVLAVQFVSAEPKELALRGMGGDENSRVTFRLVGEQGAPIRNELITFSLSATSGGISLAPDTDGDPTAETVTSDNDGLASVVLRSGTAATNVRVFAKHNSTGIEGTSESLVISTGVPVYSRFSVSFGPQAPAGAYSTDGIPVSVSIIASDQFGNSVFDGTQVSFWSRESGNIEANCQIEDGRCSVTWLSADPRPADGRATIFVYTSGAEDFGDQDADEIFDSNESWTDLSEAYADHNENDRFDSGEPFVDVTDGSRGVAGAWDDASQLPAAWDGPCVSDYCPGESSVTIWRNRTIIYSVPIATIYTYSGLPVSAADCDPLSPPQREAVNPGPGQTLNLTGGPVVIPGMYVADGRDRDMLPCHILGNPMPSGTTITYSTDNGKLSGNTSWTVSDAVQSATYINAVTLSADDNPSEGELTLTITPPAASAVAPTVFTWPVID